MVRLKTNGALAGVVILELVHVGFHDGAWIKGAVVRGCAKPEEHSSVETESGELVADALFGSRSCGPDRLSQPFERGSNAVSK